MTREGDAERARRAIPDALGHLGNTALPAPQQVLRERHSPGQQIVHRRSTHGAPEPVEEGGARQGRFAASSDTVQA